MLETIGRLLWVPLYLLLMLKTEALDLLVYRPDRDSLVGSNVAVHETPGTWTNAAPLPSYRYEFGGTALGDDIYVIGGVYLPSVYTGTSQVEVYRANTDTWEDAPRMPLDVNHIPVVTDGRYIYVVGGNRQRLQTTNSLYRYDPAAKTWQRMADMPTSRGAHGAAYIDGKVYAAGGASAGATLTTLEIYDVKTDTWTIGTPMPSPREHLAATAVGGKFHVLGGYLEDRFHTTTAHEVYDPATDTWDTKAPVPIAVAGFSAVTLGERLYIVGGEQGWAVSAEVHEYIPREDKWVRKADMPVGRYVPLVAPLDGAIHVIGGNEELGGYEFSRDHDVFVP